MVGGIDAIKAAGMAWDVTPSDSTVFKVETRAIYVGGTGDLVCWVWNPELGVLRSETWQDIPGGTTMIIQTTKVMAATTATNLKAMA